MRITKSIQLHLRSALRISISQALRWSIDRVEEFPEDNLPFLSTRLRLSWLVSLLKKLPPKLICKIYVELDGTGDVLRLARASQSFNDVWRDNAPSVCSVIMPRSILCFQDAEALLRAQEQQIGSQIQDVSNEDIF